MEALDADADNMGMAPQDEDDDRFYCPYPSCNRSFVELWRLKVHHRAPPDVRGSGKERGHGVELDICPKCREELKPGRHHVGCIAGKYARPHAKKARMMADLARGLGYPPGTIQVTFSPQTHAHTQGCDLVPISARDLIMRSQQQQQQQQQQLTHAHTMRVCDNGHAPNSGGAGPSHGMPGGPPLIQSEALPLTYSNMALSAPLAQLPSSSQSMMLGRGVSMVGVADLGNHSHSHAASLAAQQLSLSVPSHAMPGMSGLSAHHNLHLSSAGVPQLHLSGRPPPSVSHLSVVHTDHMGADPHGVTVSQLLPDLYHNGGTGGSSSAAGASLSTSMSSGFAQFSESGGGFVGAGMTLPIAGMALASGPLLVGSCDPLAGSSPVYGHGLSSLSGPLGADSLPAGFSQFALDDDGEIIRLLTASNGSTEIHRTEGGGFTLLPSGFRTGDWQAVQASASHLQHAAAAQLHLQQAQLQQAHAQVQALQQQLHAQQQVQAAQVQAHQAQAQQQAHAHSQAQAHQQAQHEAQQLVRQKHQVQHLLAQHDHQTKQEEQDEQLLEQQDEQAQAQVLLMLHEAPSAEAPSE
ncbi:hypothetical protein FOA52_008479 [Chlamydomonas sp. UWO 241]|nr:hypothetical protein FOA52_008479 [Chlamydomonas sp. UWO 241]